MTDKKISDEVEAELDFTSSTQIQKIRKDFYSFTRNDKWENNVAPVWFQELVKKYRTTYSNENSLKVTREVMKGILQKLTKPS